MAEASVLTHKSESCFRCGSGKHRRNECPFRNTKCYNCKSGECSKNVPRASRGQTLKGCEVDTDVEDCGSSSIGGVRLRKPEYGMEIHACPKDQSPGLLTVCVCVF